MGINFIKTDDENDDNYYDIKNIIKKIILNINYLNNISNKEYINEDFIIISITNCNTANDLNITNEISKGFININYEIFNIRDVIIKINRDITIKYTLTLPIQNVYNMLMDTCNNSVFESKLYSIDSNNVEKWNGIPLNDIENW